MRLPAEDVLQYIESKLNISISRDYFLSEEFYNPHHKQGRDHPAYWANNGLKDGSQTKLAEVDGMICVVDRTGTPFEGPVPISHSSRQKWLTVLK